MSKSITKSIINPCYKSLKVPSNFFQNKKIINSIFSFLSKKEIFRLIRNSSKLQCEYDIKIDDYFIPRKYQEKVKNYNNNYEDLFYQVLNDIKKEKEKNAEKFVLYEFENDMVKYLKYLTEKYNKIIKISLININDMDIWKLDFISKLLENLEKNIHLKFALDSTELKSSEILNYITPFSKAINILEIVDVSYNRTRTDNSINEHIASCFNWEKIQKIIINLADFSKKERKDSNRTERFLITFLNEIKVPNLVEFDLRCNFINFHNIEKFLKENAKNIKKMNLENYEFKNNDEINNNSIIKKFDNINELSLSINENNLEKILYLFYPIFPKIKTFYLVINENLNEDAESDIDDNSKNNIKINKNKSKDKSRGKNNKRNISKDKKSNKDKEKGQYNFNLNPFNFFSEIPNFEFSIDEISDDNDDDDFGKSRNINLKKIAFTKDKKGIKKGNKNQINIINYISTLSNLNNCEALIYEIKLNSIYSKDDSETKNYLSYLINILEANKSHLKYLEINLNNNISEPIDINDFILLIEKISECKSLSTFNFECELYNDYALAFNTYFEIGENLANLSLIHSPELDIMKIINFHKNLTNINLELISSNRKEISKDSFKRYNFNICPDREWKSIELTNYPINESLVNLLKENKNISFSSTSCFNVPDKIE